MKIPSISIVSARPESPGKDRESNWSPAPTCRLFKGILATMAVMLLVAAPLSAQTTTLFQNVRIFNGTNGEISAPSFVLVRGNTIETISTTPIATDRRADTVLIDGAGRTLMPGLIDMHWHTLLVRPTHAALLVGDIGHLNLMAGAEATDTLMRGFTTVRDLGGPAFGLKRAAEVVCERFCALGQKVERIGKSWATMPS